MTARQERPRAGRAMSWRRCRDLAIVIGVAFAARPAIAGQVPFAQLATITSTAAFSQSTLAADIDGDGDVDVLSAVAGGGTVEWYENAAGDGTAWTTRTVTSSFTQNLAAFAADVDGDGDLDVLSAYQISGTVAWHENTAGDGSAWTTRVIAGFPGYAPLDVFAADVDGDGDTDVISASSTDNTITWYENSAGDGSAWTARAIDTGAFSFGCVRAADVDGDGDVDVLAVDFDQTVAWYENTGGDGSAWTRRAIAGPEVGLRTVFVGDIDGDGDLDVLSSSYIYRWVAWYENTGGDGSAWTRRVITEFASGGAYATSAADVDGDGDLDALAVGPGNGTIAWYENTDGDGLAWTERTFGTSLRGGNSVVGADLDGDGDVDVVTSFNSDATVAWYRNETIHRSAVFGRRDVATAADGAASASAADVDGDGDGDILAASAADDTIAWHENAAGDGSTWTRRPIDTAADGARSVTAADIDGDGDLDALSASIDGDTIAWHENLAGDGTAWTKRPITATSDQPYSVAAADVDGDGDLDVLSASAGDNTVAWYENSAGDGSAWTRRVIAADAGSPRSAVATDVDGDGDLDSLVASSSAAAGVAWYENAAGDGSAWTRHAVDTSGGEPQSTAAADVDGDGDIDALTAFSQADTVAWHENVAGDGSTWSRRNITTTADGAVSVAAADADGDGDLDAFTASRVDATLAWHENVDGGGSVWVEHPVGADVGDVVAVCAADVDGDGDVDAIAASPTRDTVAWYPNRGGQLAFTTAVTAPAALVNAGRDDVLRITAAHKGRVGDHDAEIATLALGLDDGAGAPLSAPLSSDQANAVVDSLEIYRDTGNGVFDAADALVTAVGDLSLDAGVQTVAFGDADPNVQVPLGAPKTYFVVLVAASDATLQTPGAVRVTHVTEASSTAEDSVADIPLTIEHAANAATAAIGFEAPIVNLAIANDNGIAVVVPGQAVTYTVRVTNPSAVTVAGIEVRDAFPATIDGVTYTSTATGAVSGNSAGPAGGDIDDTVTMGPGSTLTYLATGTFVGPPGEIVTNTATLLPPETVTDPDTGNNSATDSDTAVAQIAPLHRRIRGRG